MLRYRIGKERQKDRVKIDVGKNVFFWCKTNKMVDRKERLKDLREFSQTLASNVNDGACEQGKIAFFYLQFALLYFQ